MPSLSIPSDFKTCLLEHLYHKDCTTTRQSWLFSFYVVANNKQDEMKLENIYSKLQSSFVLLQFIHLSVLCYTTIMHVEKVLIIKTWLGREGIYFILTLTIKESCRRSAELFQWLNGKFQLQYNETSLLLQYYKLLRGNDKMGVRIGWDALGLKHMSVTIKDVTGDAMGNLSME